MKSVLSGRPEASRTRARPAREGRPFTISKAEFERQRAAWASFTDAAWQPFVAAWRERFPDPPPGSADDDSETSLRARLWRVADEWPDELGRWVREAPGRTASEVLAYVWRQRTRLRAEIDRRLDAEQARPTNGPDAEEASEALRSILRRLADA